MDTSKSTLDLQAARKTASFDSDELNRLLNEGSRDPEMRRTVSAIIAADPAFDKAKRPYMSRAERLSSGLALTKRLFEQVDKNDWDYIEYLEALFCTDESVGVYLHEVAFQPVINSQGSDEQQAIWLPKCMNHEILGCYMQTELGHGSNVQQLETIATYEPATQTFDLHSPTITATKWWIGGLGLMATHGVVQARLILNGKDMGPHLFICQLRSMEDHSLMPNVLAGEIGPKVHGGMAALDNGWGRFNHVKIPLDQMLSRFSKLSPEGKYSKPPHDKLAYGGMIFIRAQMIGNLGWQLAKAVTISTRYLHVRRQFADPELKRGEPGFGIERQVITYPGVYMRVLPQVARAFVFITAGKDMSNLYDSMAAQLVDGNTTLLAETHAVSSGLKSYVSAAVVDGAEVVRRAMGGHGFMDAAGVGRIYATNLPAVTYEGDNNILVIQVARAALKTLAALRTNPSTALTPSTAYLSTLTTPPPSSVSWNNLPTLLHLVNLRAALSVQRLERLVQAGKQFGNLSHECVAVSKAVVEAFLCSRMVAALEEGGLLNAGASKEVKAVSMLVIHFYILNTIHDALPDLLEHGILTPSPAHSTAAQIIASPIEVLRTTIDGLAQKLLPEAIAIVDGFGFSDYDLDTALGRFDGRSYETLLERAMENEGRNSGGEDARKKMYEESIKPILERGKRLSKM